MQPSVDDTGGAEGFRQPRDDLWKVGEGDGEGDPVNFETGHIPAWSLKVEASPGGMLLCTLPLSLRVLTMDATESTLSRQGGTAEIFDLYQEDDRDPHLYPDGNIVEVCREHFIQVYD